VKGSATVGGPNGHRSNSSEIEGRPDPQLETRVPDGVPNRRAGRGRSDGGQDERLPNLWLQIMVPDGVPDGGPDGVLDGGPMRGQTGGPTRARRGARWGQTECSMGAMSSAMSSATSFLNAMSPV
jgi:hypothetical protein